MYVHTYVYMYVYICTFIYIYMYVYMNMYVLEGGAGNLEQKRKSEDEGYVRLGFGQACVCP